MTEQHRWVRVFLREILAMPRRHMFLFLLATLLLIVVGVEVIEGWHLIHLVELLGIMLVLYGLGHVACRTNSETMKQGKRWTIS